MALNFCKNYIILILGFVHVFSDRAAPLFNECSRPTEFVDPVSLVIFSVWRRHLKCIFFPDLATAADFIFRSSNAVESNSNAVTIAVRTFIIRLATKFDQTYVQVSHAIFFEVNLAEYYVWTRLSRTWLGLFPFFIFADGKTRLLFQAGLKLHVIFTGKRSFYALVEDGCKK